MRMDTIKRMESLIAKAGIAVVKLAFTQRGGANKQRNLPKLIRESLKESGAAATNNRFSADSLRAKSG
jgi:hypothetical protein